MKKSLVKRVSQIPSVLLEKASDYYARKAQEMESIEGVFSPNCSCAPIYSATKQGIYELVDIALSYLVHPLFGERITKANIPDDSWSR